MGQVGINRFISATDDFWRPFLVSLPLSNIVSLDYCVTLPNSVWVEVFASITILTTIIIDSNDYAYLFDMVSPDLRNSLAIALPFPALSSVTVKAPCIKDYPSIANSLDSRLEAGLPLDNIQPHAIGWLRQSAALNIQIHSY